MAKATAKKKTTRKRVNPHAMNPRVKRLWVKALRSGKYKQDLDQLRTDKGFCCLGVLCDLYQKDIHKRLWQKNQGRGATTYRFLSNIGVLPMDVMDWAWLDYTNPRINGKAASDWNDGGASFKEIAKLIEKHL
jgi:hypothetical protein